MGKMSLLAGLQIGEICQLALDDESIVISAVVDKRVKQRAASVSTRGFTRNQNEWKRFITALTTQYCFVLTINVSAGINSRREKQSF